MLYICFGPSKSRYHNRQCLSVLNKLISVSLVRGVVTYWGIHKVYRTLWGEKKHTKFLIYIFSQMYSNTKYVLTNWRVVKKALLKHFSRLDIDYIVYMLYHIISNNLLRFTFFIENWHFCEISHKIIVNIIYLFHEKLILFLMLFFSWGFPPLYLFHGKFILFRNKMCKQEHAFLPFS